MKRPVKDQKRDTLYLVKPARGEWYGTAGQYVGETPEYVVLRVGEVVRAFTWGDVEPVVFHQTV